MTDTDTTDLVTRLRKIADASRREDGSDIPLGEHLREAADTIERLTRERDEATRWTMRFETDLNRTMLALGDRFTLALPDGGDVHPHEAAKAAIDALAAAEARITELTRERDEARALLCKWDALIKHQYTGSREAMTDMTLIAQETARKMNL
jgi:glycine/D-amino acid oxidase-like deaminating enzyme